MTAEAVLKQVLQPMGMTRAARGEGSKWTGIVEGRKVTVLHAASVAGGPSAGSGGPVMVVSKSSAALLRIHIAQSADQSLVWTADCALSVRDPASKGRIESDPDLLDLLDRLRTPPLRSVAATPEDIQLNVDPTAITPEGLEACLLDAVALAVQLESLPAPEVSARASAGSANGWWLKVAVVGGLVGCGGLIAVAALLLVLAIRYGVV